MGNSRAKIGLFEEGILRDVLVLPNDAPIDEGQLSRWMTGAHVIVSSVNDREALLQIVADNASSYYYLTHLTPIPIRTLYKTPETLGKDRLAGVLGAWSKYKGQATLVVDIGTCMTYDLIDESGVHRGGNIAPGIDLRYRIMHTGTANLPRVKMRLNNEIMGTDTPSALQNGGLYGIICEIEGVAHRIAKEFSNFGLVLTGGDARLIGKELSVPCDAHPNLVLEGLYEILKYNEH